MPIENTETLRALYVAMAIIVGLGALFVLIKWQWHSRYKPVMAVGIPEDADRIKQLDTRSIIDFAKSEFQFINETLTEDLFIYSKLAIIIPVTAKIVVQDGGALLFYGTTTEDLIINPGGRAVVYGTVVGTGPLHSNSIAYWICH